MEDMQTLHGTGIESTSYNTEFGKEQTLNQKLFHTFHILKQ